MNNTVNDILFGAPINHDAPKQTQPNLFDDDTPAIIPIDDEQQQLQQPEEWK